MPKERFMIESMIFKGTVVEALPKQVICASGKLESMFGPKDVEQGWYGNSMLWKVIK